MAQENNTCLPDCFAGLIVYDDGCKPKNCDPSTKSLSNLLPYGVDISLMESLANDELKTFQEVANRYIATAWDIVPMMIRAALVEQKAFQTKAILFEEWLCDSPTKKQDHVRPTTQTGGRITFEANSKFACKNLCGLKIYKISGGQKTYEIIIKDEKDCMPIEKAYNIQLPNNGWNFITFKNEDNPNGYEFQSDTIDICWGDNPDLIVGGFDCLERPESCNCVGEPEPENGWRHSVFSYVGLTNGKYGIVECPQIGGIIPLVKAECKPDLFLCRFKSDVCQAVLMYVAILMLKKSIAPNCEFSSYNIGDAEWTKGTIEHVSKIMSEQINHVIVPQIKANKEIRHDDCVTCQDKYSTAWGAY